MAQPARPGTPQEAPAVGHRVATPLRTRAHPPLPRALPSEVEHLDDLIIKTERALIATWNLPDLPAQVIDLQEQLRLLTHQLDAWLKPSNTP
jgi:hypothetical protein